MVNDQLDGERLILTTEMLADRVCERFPDSSLAKVGRGLYEIAEETDRTVRWISKPSLGFRIFILTVIAILTIALFGAIAKLKLQDHDLSFVDWVQMSEALLNVVVLIGAAIIFLVSIENRTKRSKVIRSINKLRSIAHVIDMHQLTKDPNVYGLEKHRTKTSPERDLTPFELERYLDYCSEMLSITSKIAFLYIQNFDDPVCVDAVNDLENLCTGLSRKIWQKIIILSKYKSGELS